MVNNWKNDIADDLIERALEDGIIHKADDNFPLKIEAPKESIHETIYKGRKTLIIKSDNIKLGGEVGE